MFIDSHCHIDGSEFDADREEVIARARSAGVSKLLNVGTGDPQSGAFERAVELAEKHTEVYAAVGLHPHDAKLFDDAASQRLLKLVQQSKRVVAWGEIGLDYHYDHSPREVQRVAFQRQLELAHDANLPIVVHTREAEADTIEILRDGWNHHGARGVMHCFSGSLELARATMELGFLISFSGVVTFKKADQLRSVAAAVPLDRLLIETDCPYLSPVPYRGWRNEPAYVVEVARTLATIHGKTLEEMGSITSANFLQLFPFTGA